MSLEPADINSIVAALQESTWDQAVVQVGDVTISVARNGATLPSTAAPTTQPSAPANLPDVESSSAPPAPDAVPPTPRPIAVEAAPARDDSAPTDHVILAPSVGVFWRQPEPGAEPFVSIGDRVGDGDTVAIIEVMKLMNNLPAGVSGQVTAIHVQNGESVEHGTPLFSVALEA